MDLSGWFQMKPHYGLFRDEKKEGRALSESKDCSQANVVEMRWRSGFEAQCNQDWKLWSKDMRCKRIKLFLDMTVIMSIINIENNN